MGAVFRLQTRPHALCLPRHDAKDDEANQSTRQIMRTNLECEIESNEESTTSKEEEERRNLRLIDYRGQKKKTCYDEQVKGIENECKGNKSIGNNQCEMIESNKSVVYLTKKEQAGVISTECNEINQRGSTELQDRYARLILLTHKILVGPPFG